MSPSASTDPSKIAEVNRPDRVRAQIAELRKTKPAAEAAPAGAHVERDGAVRPGHPGPPDPHHGRHHRPGDRHP